MPARCKSRPEGARVSAWKTAEDKRCEDAINEFRSDIISAMVEKGRHHKTIDSSRNRRQGQRSEKVDQTIATIRQDGMMNEDGTVAGDSSL